MRLVLRGAPFTTGACDGLLPNILLRGRSTARVWERDARTAGSTGGLVERRV